MCGIHTESISSGEVIIADYSCDFRFSKILLKMSFYSSIYYTLNILLPPPKMFSSSF